MTFRKPVPYVSGSGNTVRHTVEIWKEKIFIFDRLQPKNATWNYSKSLDTPSNNYEYNFASTVQRALRHRLLCSYFSERMVQKTQR